jgi:hypothetical protein
MVAVTPESVNDLMPRFTTMERSIECADIFEFCALKKVSRYMFNCSSKANPIRPFPAACAWLSFAHSSIAKLTLTPLFPLVIYCRE